MKVIPVASPNHVATTNSSEASSKARAVAAFNAAQAQETPPVDPNAISVEELSAVQPAKASGDVNLEVDNSTETVNSEIDKPTQVETKEDPALSRQFAQLARREKQLRLQAQKQQNDFKAKEAALVAREAALSQTQFDPKDYISRARLEQDALGVLESEGIATYEGITQRAVSRQPVDPQLQAHIGKLEAKIAQLEKATEDNQKSYTQQQQQAYDAALKQIRSDVRDLVQNDPNFETIKATNSIGDVVDLIKQTYEKDGRVLPVELAAQKVEDYLVEEATKLTRIGKIKKRLEQSAQTERAQKPQATTKQPQQSMKTLTNANSSTRQLSAKERAILAFKGELKS